MTTLGFTCLKDDGPYIVEWVAHHLAAGFDQMLVLTHDCSDGSEALMAALTADPRVLHLPFAPRGEKSVQWQALALAGKAPSYKGADWALFFDVDEFLCFDGPGSVGELIDEAGGDAIALPWRLFGSGGQQDRGDGLTPERFHRAAPADLHFPRAHLLKTLHRPGAFQKPGVHRPRARKGESPVWSGPDGARMPDGFSAAQNATSLYGYTGARRAWLNHYSLRSKDEFLVKSARGLPNHMEREIGVTYWVERNWNDVEERRIEAMMPATRAEYARLMDLPGVAEAHDACLSAHAARRAALARNVDAERLSLQLEMAGSSTAPAPEHAARLLQTVRAAKAGEA